MISYANCLILIISAHFCGKKCREYNYLCSFPKSISMHAPNVDIFFGFKYDLYVENRAHKYPIMGPASRSLRDSIPARRRLRVAKDGSGNFATINDAVKNVPTNQNEYFLISVGEGTFEEYVEVTADRPYIVLVGAGEGKTIITGKHSKGTGWGTFYSATLRKCMFFSFFFM